MRLRAGFIAMAPPSVPCRYLPGALDHVALDRGGPPVGRQGGLRVERADVLDALVADAGEGLRLLAQDRGLEPRVVEPGERRLDAEEAEEREHEPAARREVRGSARDHPVEQGPAVRAAVVGRRRRVGALAIGRRGHLGRARADQVEDAPAHRREAVAQEHLDAIRHAVDHRVRARAAHRRVHHVGRDHPRSRRARPAPRPGRSRCRSRASDRPRAPAGGGRTAASPPWAAAPRRPP